jgi:hypothetical protein
MSANFLRITIYFLKSYHHARLGGEAINGNLVVGASVQVTFVMNVATGMSVTG